MRSTKYLEILKENLLRFKAPVFVITGLIVAYFLGFYFGKSANQFNPALVAEKQKCQEAFLAWKAGHNDAMSPRFHFSPSLNTCLVEYSWENLSGLDFLERVIDIYDSNRVIVEMDLEKQGTITGEAGNYLLVNGTYITPANGDVASEYNKRASSLFKDANFF
ncbi:MAG: hypothetical protein KGI60_01960 [Patescibacteria group bacterium]|nr:hypothetical protein [Patescibacteria group bacterium]